MRGLLVRVGADLSPGGGCWNGPVDSTTGQFVYVAIPESADRPSRDALGKPYRAIANKLDAFGSPLPFHLAAREMHLDPDFDHLTYGDQGQRAKQLQQKLGSGDLIVFYSGLRDVRHQRALVYALTGLFVVDRFVNARDVPAERWHENAHTRRAPEPDGIIARARPKLSGRLQRCIPIGDYREKAYRVWPRLLEEWGGLQVRNGYLQRSARLPEFGDARRFYQWFLAQAVPLVQSNT